VAKTSSLFLQISTFVFCATFNRSNHSAVALAGIRAREENLPFRSCCEIDKVNSPNLLRDVEEESIYAHSILTRIQIYNTKSNVS
jgi:hypothetical protein